jgi:O-antigen ligase
MATRPDVGIRTRAFGLRLAASVAAAGVALGAGWFLWHGEFLIACAIVAVPALAVWSAVEPHKAVQAFLVILPLLFYAASVGSLSLFIGLPMAVFISVALLVRVRDLPVVERPQLPINAYAVLAAVATVSAVLSERMVPASSRVIYLLAFGLFAWALGRSIAAGLVTRRALVEAIVAGATLAAVVLLGQFLAQFVIDLELLLVEMGDLKARFAGARTAETTLMNWVVPDLPLIGEKLVRGAFPFVIVPSAGQYLMLSLVGAVWLAVRASVPMSRAASVVTWSAVGVLAAALIATYSRQSWFGALVGVALLLGWHRRRGMLLLAAGAAALAALVPLPGSGRTLLGELVLGSQRGESNESYLERLELLENVPSEILVSPVYGVGPGQYSVLGPGFQEGGVYYAHNLLVDSAVELGLLGAAALLFLFVHALIKSARVSPGLGVPLLAAYLAANLFDDTFYFPRNGFLLAAVFAVACTRPAHASDERAAEGTPIPLAERVVRWLRGDPDRRQGLLARPFHKATRWREGRSLRELVPWRLAVAVLAFAGLRIYAGALDPHLTPDTPAYEQLDFFGGAPRLWTVPLLYTVVTSDSLRVVAQLAIGVVAWSLLAIAVHWAVRDRFLRWAGTVTVLLLGLTPQVTKWDSILMSESLSISLLVLSIAGVLLVAQTRPTALQIACVLTAVLLWAFTRQINALTLVALLPLLLLWFARRLNGRAAAALAVTLVLIAAWGGFATSRDQQIWKYNGIQVLVNRIVPDNDDLRYFKGRGLPTPPALFQEGGTFSGTASPLWEDAGFMAWIDAYWRDTYFAFLVRDPVATVTRPLPDAQDLLSAGATLPDRPVDHRTAVPPPTTELLWDSQGSGQLALLLAAGLLVVLAALRRGVSIRNWETPTLLLAMTVIGGLLTWHSAAADLERLFIPVALMVRLGLLLLVLLAVDAWLTERRGLEVDS